MSLHLGAADTLKQANLRSDDDFGLLCLQNGAEVYKRKT